MSAVAEASTHLEPLITDLGLILMTAGIAVLLFKKLKQPLVLQQIIEERHVTHVRGVMLESHLVDGNQKISCDMTYGQSVTDGCLGWNKTEQLLLDVAEQLSKQDLLQTA